MSALGLILFRTIRTTAKRLTNEKSASTLKTLKVAIIGRPNVGKSTLLNKLVGYQISSVSNKVHTTRVNTLGVLTEDDVQIEYLDSPGIVSRDHARKHRLEASIFQEPKKASDEANLIAVVADASSRLDNKLGRETLNLLNEHSDKKSILILNKVDLVKDKRILLDLSTRLSMGYVDGRRSIKNINRLSEDEKRRLNLLSLDSLQKHETGPLHKYVTDLEPRPEVEEVIRPAGYDKFSRIFLVSSLKEDGIKDVKNFFVDMAYNVQEWPHKANFITNSNYKKVVLEIIRGKIMDHTSNATPYLFDFKFQQCAFDNLDCLHVFLNVICLHGYEGSEIVGEKGMTLRRIISESREIISNTLGCDAVLKINVTKRHERNKTLIHVS